MTTTEPTTTTETLSLYERIGGRAGLEKIVPDDLWPLPTYQEMLFIK